jgi:two-component system heavy metal sensor histidine kinase CusS
MNRVRRWFKQWSITSKLTFIYVSMTSLILIMIVIAAYWAMQKVITVAETQFIYDEVQIIGNLLEQTPHNSVALFHELNPVTTLWKTAEYRYYVQIYDDNGKLLMQTNGMHKEIPDPYYPALCLNSWQKHSRQWQSVNGNYYLSMRAPIRVNQKDKPNYYIDMVFDGSYPVKMVRQYRNKALILLCIAILIVIGLGRFATRKGLSRLYEMTDIIEGISADKLADRIDIKEWPKELIPLGDSYNNMLERIENSFQRLSDCSAQLAHDLRTPINNLMLTTEIILTNYRKSSEYKAALESNYEEYRRLARIIDNVLFLAKTENPTYSIEKVAISVNAELHKIIEFYKIMASEKNIQMSLEGEGTLKTELVLFQRLIGNVLANAIKYTDANGMVCVSIKNEADKFLVLLVKDTGTGIPEDHLLNVFNKFYRVRLSQSYDTGGAGLGLAIVKSIMLLHGGEVKIESELGKGTTVSLWFPCLH